MSITYLALGSNLGDKRENIYKAISLIAEQIGTILDQSALYTSKPWGFQTPNLFINAVIRVETNFTPQELLKASQNIEKEIGRSQKSSNGQYADRRIDIDILFYDNIILNSTQLTIPHPHILDRDFVLIPLNELSPSFIHPITNKAIKTYITPLDTLDKLK